MLSAVWAARWYLLLGLLSLLVFLAVSAPLQFVWQYAEPQLGRMPVKVNSVAGTIWDGRFQIQHRQLGVVDGEWQLSPLALLGGSLAGEVKASNDRLRLNGQWQASSSGVIEVENLDGFVDISLLNPELRRQRVTLAGELEASALQLTIDANQRQLQAVSGRLVYGGGDASFPVQRKQVNAEVPMIVGNLGMNGDKAVLDIVNTDGEALAQGFLQPDGWAGVAVRRRFIDTIGQKWPQKADVDTVIFEVSHKIL